MCARIGIYPDLHGEGDIGCVSLEALDVPFQKVVQMLVVYRSPVVTMPKRHLGTNEEPRVRAAISDGRVEKLALDPDLLIEPTQKATIMLHRAMAFAYKQRE